MGLSLEQWKGGAEKTKTAGLFSVGGCRVRYFGCLRARLSSAWDREPKVKVKSAAHLHGPNVAQSCGGATSFRVALLQRPLTVRVSAKPANGPTRGAAAWAGCSATRFAGHRLARTCR